MARRKGETKEEYNLRSRIYMAEWRSTHRENLDYKDTKCRQQKRCRDKLRYMVLEVYGGKCSCCGETTPEFLGIDHINGGGNQHIIPGYNGGRRLGGVPLYRWLRDNNYPIEFQALCHNCNLAKGFYGSCPHTKNERVPIVWKEV